VRHLLAATLTVVCAVSLAQSASLPQPQDSGPSLAVTMKYIEEKLNAASVTSLVTFGGATYVARVAITLAKADPQDCKLSWHFAESDDSAPDHIPIAPRRLETDWALSLRDAGAVTVQTMSDYHRHSPGYSGNEMELRPDYYVLSIKMQPEKTALAHVGRAEGANWSMPFADVQVPDEDIANRLSRAVDHAITLCGGGDKDPFKMDRSGSASSGSSQSVGISSLQQLGSRSLQSGSSLDLGAPAASARPASATESTTTAPFAATAQSETFPNWCADSARVSYKGNHNSASNDLMLEFSLYEGHKERRRGINWHYRVTYSCYQRGLFTKEDSSTESLDPGTDSKGFDEEFLAHECPLPDQSYPHIERVEIIGLNCN